MNTNEHYRGVWPVMLTPFDEQREIDWDSLKKLIDWYIKAGVNRLLKFVPASTRFAG